MALQRRIGIFCEEEHAILSNEARDRQKDLSVSVLNALCYDLKAVNIAFHEGKDLSTRIWASIPSLEDPLDKIKVEYPTGFILQPHLTEIHTSSDGNGFAYANLISFLRQGIGDSTIRVADLAWDRCWLLNSDDILQSNFSDVVNFN